MKKLTSLLFLIVAVISLHSCAKVEEPVFRNVQNFKVKKLGLQEAQIGLNVVYFNPNKFGVQIKEAALDIYFDSTFIGRFTQPTSVGVERKADFSIPLEGSIPLSKVLQLKAGDIINKEVQVRAEGSVKVGKGGIFVDRDIKYNGRHKLDAYL